MPDRRASSPDPTPPARPVNDIIGVSAPLVAGFQVQATEKFNLACIDAGVLLIVSSVRCRRSVPSSRSPPRPNEKRCG